MKRNNSVKKSKKKKGLNILIAFFAAVLLVLAGWLVYNWLRMNETEDNVRIIKETVTIYDPVSAADKDATSDSSEDDGIDPYLKRQIDFDQLKAINSDTATWLTIPETNIDSYALREPEPGQFFYEHRDIYKNEAFGGSFVLPALMYDDENRVIEDDHMMIFGHYMYGYFSDWMFTKLQDYYANPDVAKTHQYVYLYYPDHSERWKIAAAQDAKPDEEIYSEPYVRNTPDYEQLMQYIGSKARYVIEPLDAGEKTLMLSTCQMTEGGNWDRFAVTFVPDAGYDYASGTVYDLKARQDAEIESPAGQESENGQNR